LTSEVDPELSQTARKVADVYFDDYMPVTASILEESRAPLEQDTIQFGVGFNQFFEQSSAALGGFEHLVFSAGDFLTSSWNERRKRASTLLTLNATGLVALIAALVLVGLIVRLRVTSRFESATSALTSMASGDLDQSLKLGRGELSEIRALDDSLSNLNTQLSEAREANKVRATQQEQQQQVVEALSAGLTSLAQGDVSFRITEPFEGSYEGLRENFNTSCDKLDSLIGEVVRSARSITGPANNLSESFRDLKTRTTEQAGTAMQTATSVETVAESVQFTAQKAAETDDYVSTARANAESGGQIVEDAIGAMGEIKKSSDHISQTVGLIDDIAFQTNLLALNAGVEAASTRVRSRTRNQVDD